MKALVFDAPRTGYSIDQVSKPMTVADLKELLQDFEDDDIIILSHDRGYTYGTPQYMDTYTANQDEDGDPEWEAVGMYW